MFDPHLRAFQRLSSEDAVEMVERYSRAAKREIALAEYVPLTESLDNE